MSQERPDRGALAIVLGCGEVGSAIALGLHGVGLSVVLVDHADPAWHRRGRAFTNAWYVGNAELDGAGACFCASLKSIPSVLARGMIAATTWSWPSVAGALRPAVLADARGRKRRGADVFLGLVPITFGIGPGFVEGENVDVAVPLPATLAREGGAARNACGMAAIPGDPGEVGCIVEAARPGRFMTERRVGESVGAGQIVGGLGNEVITAPAAGVLLGLAARGARIETGDTLVEVDPAGVADRCYGVAEGPRRIAAAVVAKVAAHRSAGQGSGSRDQVGRLLIPVP